MSEVKEREIIHKYLNLATEYLNDSINSSEFSQRYLDEFKDDDAPISDDTFWILQNLFAEADAYCESDIREDVRDSVDEQELTRAVRETVTGLERRLRELDH